MYCYFFVLFSFTFGRRNPHPPFVLLFLSIYSRVVSYQKKKNIPLSNKGLLRCFADCHCVNAFV